MNRDWDTYILFIFKKEGMLHHEWLKKIMLRLDLAWYFPNGAGELAQSGKCLMHKQGDPSSSPSPYVKKQHESAHPVGWDKSIPGTCQPSRLADSANSQFKRESLSKKKKKKDGEEFKIPGINFLFPHSLKHRYKSQCLFLGLSHLSRLIGWLWPVVCSGSKNFGIPKLEFWEALEPPRSLWKLSHWVKKSRLCGSRERAQDG